MRNRITTEFDIGTKLGLATGEGQHKVMVSILFHDDVAESIAQSMVFIGKFKRGGALNITR